MTTITSKFTKERLIDWAVVAVAERVRDLKDAPESVEAAANLKLAEIALAALTAEPVAWTDRQELKDVEKDGLGYLFTVNPITPNADPRRVIELYTAPPTSEREQVRHEHAEWSDDTFGDVGPIGPLKHLSKEALEAAADPSDLLEWADMQLLLWDAQRRAGITDKQITQAVKEKLAVNKKREWPEPKDGEPRLHIKEQPVPVMPPGLHPDTQKLVADFSTDLAEKLYKAQLKYGYDADWKQDNWSTQCLAHFHQHIAKGDPRDVAAYCAFMWYHDWKTEPATAPVVPEECPADISVLMASHSDALFYDDDAQEIWNACRAAMLQGGFRDLSQPVDPQVTEYEQIMLRAGWVMVPVEPTDEMIAAAMECDDVVFDSKDPTAFCVQYREIYYAMVDAAPKQEGNNG